MRMIELLAEDLREVVETVWTVTLGFEVLGPAGSLPPPPECTWCGCIQVAGAWSGLVKLSMGEALARKAAAAMFGAPADTLSTDDLTDALGEITNMTGGSVKALLPGPSQLSLPSVVTGDDFSVSSPGGVILREVAFQTSGSQIRVQVIEGRARPYWDELRGAASTRLGSEP
jgi:chemotaxis protein CheX